jgi:transcription-repair coupling factor (superfamily II helicase)
VTGERLRLEVYRKIAEAGDRAALDGIAEELTDRYGTPPDPVRNLLAVAAFRQACRRFGVTEVALAGSSIRLGPMELPDSAQLRLKRLHPRSTYKASTGTVVVPRPAAGSAGGGARMGAAPMRDTELLDWCARLLGDVVSPVPAPA